MEKEKIKGIIESILFAAGREVKISELMSVLELGSDEVIDAVDALKEEYKEQGRGLEIVNIEDAYQLCTKKKIMNIFTRFLIKEVSQTCLMPHWKL